MNFAPQPILPIFDKANEEYDANEDGSTAEYTNDPLYFIRRIEGPAELFFDLDFFIDVILAPTSVCDYACSHTLVEVFYGLYPRGAAYKEALQRGSECVDDAISFVTNQWPDKTAILSYLSLTQKKLEQNVLRIKALSLKDADYVQISAEYSRKLIELIHNASQKVVVKPSDVILYKYYLDHPSESWVGDPFAFFTYTFIERISLDVYTAHWEVTVTINRIFQRIDRLTTDQNKQAYFDSLCPALNILYQDGNEQTKNACVSIVARLSHRSDGFSFPVEFDFGKPESSEIKIETKDFVKKVFELKAEDQWLREYTFLNLSSTKQADYYSLIAGDLEGIDRLEFNWPRETCFYFLMRLQDNGATFNVTALERNGLPPKVFLPKTGFSEEKRPFKRSGFYTFCSDYNHKDGCKIKRNICFDLIDSLFS